MPPKFMRRLTNANTQTSGNVWLDRNKVVLNDSHVVAVNRKDVRGSRRSIDKSQHMPFAFGESRVEIPASSSQRIMAYAIDNKAVCVGKPTRYLNIVTNERRVVDIVLDQDWTKVNIPVAA